MSTKAQIEALINSDLASGTQIPATNHRNVLKDDPDSVVTNFYGIKTSDRNATTNVFTEDSSTKTYVANAIKQGGKVSLYGTLNNGTGAITSPDTVWFSITNTEYEQQTSSPRYPLAYSGSTGEPVRCVLTSNVLATIDPIGIGETIYFEDLTYNTNA